MGKKTEKMTVKSEIFCECKKLELQVYLEECKKLELQVYLEDSGS